jgi:hypothetical protein
MERIDTETWIRFHIALRDQRAFYLKQVAEAFALGMSPELWIEALQRNINASLKLKEM